MKTLFLSAAVLGATVLTGCVIAPPPPPLVTISEPAPVYSPGYVVRTLPSGYYRTTYNRRVYYVNRNVYYQRQRGGYVVVQRPY
jgi:hypothetical protein